MNEEAELVSDGRHSIVEFGFKVLDFLCKDALEVKLDDLLDPVKALLHHGVEILDWYL